MGFESCPFPSWLRDLEAVGEWLELCVVFRLDLSNAVTPGPVRVSRVSAGFESRPTRSTIAGSRDIGEAAYANHRLDYGSGGAGRRYGRFGGCSRFTGLIADSLIGLGSTAGCVELAGGPASFPAPLFAGQ